MICIFQKENLFAQIIKLKDLSLLVYQERTGKEERGSGNLRL